MFVGPRKNYELFAGEPASALRPLEYRRGGLRERLAVWDELEALLSAADSVVIDPDSRLTQLGLLPVCPEDRYHLFESRAYGSDSDRDSAGAGLGMGRGDFRSHRREAVRCPARRRQSCRTPYIAVSLGVGENPAKRLADPFEQELLSAARRHRDTAVHRSGRRGRGAGAGDARRRGCRRPAPPIWNGSFAGLRRRSSPAAAFMSGYDSAGQHVAAACGVPLISVFAGFPVAPHVRPLAPLGEPLRDRSCGRSRAPGDSRQGARRTAAHTGQYRYRLTLLTHSPMFVRDGESTYVSETARNCAICYISWPQLRRRRSASRS